MPSNQKKIRDLTRILRKLQQSQSSSEHDAETANKGNEEQIAQINIKIKELEESKEGNKQKEVKRKHENKYHLVKFVERKKVTRMIHKIIKQLESANVSGEERTKLEKKKQSLEDDLVYIMYYPVDMKYIALFANSEDEEGTPSHEKTSKLSMKARELARAARQEDIEKDREDKVAHAMEVELQGGNGGRKETTEGKEPSQQASQRNMKNSSTNNKRKRSSNEEEDNRDNDRQTDNHREKRGGEQGGDDENNTSNQIMMKNNKKRKNDKESVASNEQNKASKSNSSSQQLQEKKESKAATDRLEEEDEFFLDEEKEKQQLLDPTSNPMPKPTRLPLNYQQVKQTVDRRKFHHHKRFSSKPSNFKKF
jgi:hypothetical protein